MRIFGISAILLAILIWNVPGFARAAGTATLKTGKEVNEAIKQLIYSSATYTFPESNINEIEWNSNAATGGMEISTSGSETPVYIKLSDDEKTVYIYSDADKIFTDPDASYMFYFLSEVKNISSEFLNRLDTSNTSNFEYMFANDSSLTSVDVSSFDTSKAVNVQSMFLLCEKLPYIDLSNFNLYNVRNNYAMWILSSCPLLSRIETPYNTMYEDIISTTKLNYDDYHELYDNGTQSYETYDSIPSGLTESITLVRDYDAPIATPTPSPTSPPTTAPTATPTSVATATPTTRATATPTSTASTATATPTTRATATPTSAASTATATPTTRATATPTTAGTATPIPWNTNNYTGGTTYTYNGTSGQFNPAAVVRSNANDMPRTGDGDAARLIVVALLFVVGCIALVSSIPAKNRA